MEEGPSKSARLPTIMEEAPNDWQANLVEDEHVQPAKPSDTKKGKEPVHA